MILRKRIRKIAVTIVLVGTLSVSTLINAASSGSTYINSTYGWLQGTVNGGIATFGKISFVTAKTTNAVPRIRAKLEMVETATGKNIGAGIDTGWSSNDDYVETYDYELDNFREDGYKTITVTAYGTSDAITSTPYVVYTNLTY